MIHIPGRTYYLEDSSGDQATAELWVQTISSLQVTVHDLLWPSIDLSPTSHAPSTKIYRPSTDSPRPSTDLPISSRQARLAEVARESGAEPMSPINPARLAAMDSFRSVDEEMSVRRCGRGATDRP